MIDLSILICSTHTRATTFGRAIQNQVWPQYESLPPELQARIEILMLTDNKKLVLGEKRNHLIRLASGKYVLFVDDDDRIEPDMFATLLEAAKSGADAIVFDVSVTLNDWPAVVCRYSKDFPGNRNLPGEYQRWPNHMSMIRRELALEASFPAQLCGEDTIYAERLHPLLKSEHRINKILYHYDFSQLTTETQQKPVCDVIILSNATTINLQVMTQEAVDTARNTTLPVTVTVVEQTPTVYRNANTVHRPGEFNYNAFANEAAAGLSAPWIVIANNDLVFSPNWLEPLLNANHPLVSPKCPNDPRQTDIHIPEIGSQNGRHFSGWCFAINRGLWSRMGGFDSEVSFWCSDDVVIRQAEQLGVTPMIVPASQVTHLRSTTLNTEPDRDALTWAQLDRYITKYGSHQLENHPDFLRWKTCTTSA